MAARTHQYSFQWIGGHCSDPDCCRPEPLAECSCGERFFGVIDEEDGREAHAEHVKASEQERRHKENG